MSHTNKECLSQVRQVPSFKTINVIALQQLATNSQMHQQFQEVNGKLAEPSRFGLFKQA